MPLPPIGRRDHDGAGAVDIKRPIAPVHADDTSASKGSTVDAQLRRRSRGLQVEDIVLQRDMEIGDVLAGDRADAALARREGVVGVDQIEHERSVPMLGVVQNASVRLVVANA